MNNDGIKSFIEDVQSELMENIVPFWMNYSLDQQYGGFVGRLTNDLNVETHAPKGLILITRLLWTFSALYRFTQDDRYQEMADRAYRYLTNHHLDTNYGGYYWTLNYLGEPVDIKKKVYGQAFSIYALTEYASATGEQAALQQAVAVYELLEQKSRDADNEGYFESYNRDWTLAEDLRLSKKDMDEKKSMNTHLHMLEAYTRLAREWDDVQIRQSLSKLISVFRSQIIDSDYHCFRLFFDEQWCSKTNRASFGHDIEGSWLLTEAAEIFSDEILNSEIASISLDIVQAVLERGIDDDGGLVYEATPEGICDYDKHWWPQAEAVVGFVNAYQLSQDSMFLDNAQRCWNFIKKYIVDNTHGEWYWKVTRDGRPDPAEYKISEWKGPYHNVRACLEVIKRLENFSTGS